MPIVSSIITIDRVQVDGRRKIIETHTDHLGGVHEQRYTAESAQNVSVGLVARAAAIQQRLADEETEANLAEIEGSVT